MNERSEKIVTLAREMLRSGMPPMEPTRAQISMSFKVLCFSTMIAALGSSAVTAVSYEQKRPINHYEKTKLDALVFYTAHLKGMDEAILKQQVTKIGNQQF